MGIRLLQKMLKQTLVYWPPAGNDGFGGKTFGEPVEIRCRWLYVNELFVGPQKKEIMSQAKAFPDNQAVRMELAGMAMEGTLAEVEAQESNDPYDLELSDGRKPFEIMKVGGNPTFQGDEESRTVWM